MKKLLLALLFILIALPLQAQSFDTDDGSVATGQEMTITIPLTYYFDGANWKRWDSSVIANPAADVTVSDTLDSLNDTVEITLSGRTSITVQVTGSWTGSMSPQVTVDGTNWTFIDFYDVTSTQWLTFIDGTDINDVWHVGVGSYIKFRVLAFSWTSGAATIAIRAGNGLNIQDSFRLRDFSSSDVARVKSTTPSSSDEGLVIREAQRGQGTMTTSIPVVISSNQSKIPIQISQTTTDNDVDVITLPAITFAVPQHVIVDSGSITFTNASIIATATDLDIRNLVFATDKVDVSGSSSVGVTGIFFQATQPISAVSLPLPTGAATSALQTQPGVDIGDVTINNAGAGSAVNIQDGGNSITVDGTVTVTDGAGALNVIVDSGTVTANQGTPNTTANRWPVQITDGTDLAQVTATSGGSLQVECSAGCGGAATFTDGGAGFTQESSQVNAPSGFIFDDTIGTTLSENDIAAARITAARAQVMRLEGVTRGTYQTLTGTSADVNCTGGCGTPTQGQTYFATAIRGASGAAVRDYLNLFNAAGSNKVLKIVSIRASSDNTAAVTGLGWTAELNVTSTVGTTCTAITIRLADSNNAAVPAQVTSSHTCTTDPVVTFEWAACQLNTDEAAVLRGPAECYRFENSGGQPVTLREGQGIMIRTSNAVAPAGLVTVTIEFTM